MCSNVPSKSVVLCLQVPLDPDILYIISHALLVKMFDWGFQFLEWAFVFFRPPAYLFAKKRTLNNELTKGGLTMVRKHTHAIRIVAATSWAVMLMEVQVRRQGGGGVLWVPKHPLQTFRPWVWLGMHCMIKQARLPSSPDWVHAT